jgi:arsenate reductase
MPPLTVYVKPTCTSCRKAVDFLEGEKAEFETVDIFKTPPTADVLRDICGKLGVSPREILRKKDPAYGENDLDSGRHTDAQLYALMAANPGLIQRPIVVKGKRAVVARPAERAADLLK